MKKKFRIDLADGGLEIWFADRVSVQEGCLMGFDADEYLAPSWGFPAGRWTRIYALATEDDDE